MGYYQWDSGARCNVDLNSTNPLDQWSAVVNSRRGAYYGGAEGSVNMDQDLRNISCRLAWYIYQTYTSNLQNVRVVAHSMGGLVFAPLSPAAAHGAVSSANRVWIECQTTYETDNIDVRDENQPFAHDLGNTWSVNYDIKRDTVDNVACDMRVVARIFNPAPNGTLSGTFAVKSTHGADLVSGSFGKHTGLSTYAAHLVWRGPWFGVNPGWWYHIEIDEYNGSNVCIQCKRAMTNFNL